MQKLEFIHFAGDVVDVMQHDAVTYNANDIHGSNQHTQMALNNLLAASMRGT